MPSAAGRPSRRSVSRLSPLTASMSMPERMSASIDGGATLGWVRRKAAVRSTMPSGVTTPTRAPSGPAKLSSFMCGPRLSGEPVPRLLLGAQALDDAARLDQRCIGADRDGPEGAGAVEPLLLDLHEADILRHHG